LPRCSRIRAAFKKTLSSSLLAGNRAFRQKQLPWNTLNRKTVTIGSKTPR
jgi:hypothetical protein